MNWNAFNLVSSAIKKTKERLLPFNFKEWVKLGIIAALSSGTGRSFNSNYKGGGSGKKFDIESLQPVRDFIGKYWWQGGLIFLPIFLILTLLSYIGSVFSFIFIESLINKKAKFTFRKNHDNGLALFLFKFTISIITMIVIAALASPYIYHFMKANSIVQSVGLAYIILSILAVVLYFIALFILFLFLYDFAVPYMYVKKIPTLFALKTVWKDVLKNKVSTLIYIFANIVLSIAIAILGFFIVIATLLVFLLPTAILFAISLLLYKVASTTFTITLLAIIFGGLLLTAFIFMLIILFLPFSVFIRYFELLNFEKLTKLKILKK